MIKLKNVSKFYYSKGVIASGFTKVNLEFKIGEFVAITGESGSGKSTLLNVISGLDTYEEGEMFINGKETSHYIEKDWEDYRRKNIGNIYQNFNLVNSYTVYQNIDLALSLNGCKCRERKEKILSLLKRVDMLKYKNTKVSKLSGGQKQRVAIARALAKDIPIIVADEPTGSLDKRSAENIIKLLKEISKDKLVIIVTHNYDQVEEYVTRKITMHDGRVIEDSKIKPISEDVEYSEHNYKNINIFEKIRLGVRNTFNVKTKFVLLFLVYAFIVSALTLEYSFFKVEEYENSKSGYNMVYTDTNDHRVVINKKDKSSFSDEEINNLKKLSNVDYVVENDLTIDERVAINTENNYVYFNGNVGNFDELDGKVDYGRMPEADNEIVIQGFEEDYYIGEDYRDELMNENLYFVFNDSGVDKTKVYKVVGFKYIQPGIIVVSDNKFYLSSNAIKDLSNHINRSYSEVVVDFMGKNYKSSNSDNNFSIETNAWVPQGEAFISEDFDMYCDKYECLNKSFNVNIKNIYFTDSKSFTIKKKYTSKNIGNILNLPDYKKENYEEFYNGKIYVNPDDFNSLFNKGTYQMSVYVSDIEKIDNTISKLNDMGYNTLAIKDTLVNPGILQVIKIFKMITTIVLVVVLFFISYFIIKIILKSRNVYFSILRMLGASKGVCRELLIIELFTISNLSYFIFSGLVELNKTKYLNVKFLDTVNTYFKFDDYVILYLLIVGMSVIISMRYARKLFKNSVMNTYREED